MIRTTTIGRRKFFCAKDLAESMNIPWRKYDTLAGAVQPTQIFFVAVTSQDGRAREMYALSAEGVKQFKRNKESRTPAAKKERNLKQELSALKTMAAQQFIQTDKRISGLSAQEGRAKVVNQSKVDTLQKEAWHQTRQLCESYANRRAEAEGVDVGSDKSRVYHNLTYTALYHEFKQQFKVDLKALAEQSARRGQKKSILEVAAENGYAIQLLGLAETLFGKSK